MSSLDDQLGRWMAAGILDRPTADAIRAYEGTRTPEPRRGDGVSLQEVVAYAGVALALAGGALLVALHREAFGLAGRLLIDAVLAGAGVSGARRLGGMRAAAGCVMVAVLAGGLACGDAAASTGLLTVRHVYGEGMPWRYEAVDHGGDAALGFAAMGALALVALRSWGLSPLFAGLAAVGAYGCCFAMLASRDVGPAEGELLTGLTGAVLAAVSSVERWRREVEGEVLRFWGVVLPAVALCFPRGAGYVLAGLAVSTGALWASVRFGSNACAVAGGLGLFAVVVDVGVRWFSGPLGLPLVLIGAGAALIGLASLIQRIVVGNRGRVAPS